MSYSTVLGPSAQQPRPDGMYDCCPEGDEKPCPQAQTGHDLPCNAPYCSLHSPTAASNRVLSDFRIIHAEWAIPPDVVAVEHVKSDGALCLVYSTTLAMPLDGINAMCVQHASTCQPKGTHDDDRDKPRDG